MSIINKSMRENYNKYGAEKYYSLVSSSYRNPHFPAIKQCIFTWMNKWWRNEGRKMLASPTPVEVRIMDMAAGSGEATVSVMEWWDTAMLALSQSPPVYPPNGPTPPAVGPTARPKLLVTATDPFTVQAYTDRTGLTCLPLSFHDLALGSFPDTFSLALQLFPSDGSEPLDDKAPSQTADVQPSSTFSQDAIVDPPPSPYIMDMIICSFALHLVQTPSELFSLLWELSTKAQWLIVISPHKKPEIKDTWGWALWNSDTWKSCAEETQGFAEILKDRVHCRIFKSYNV